MSARDQTYESPEVVLVEQFGVFWVLRVPIFYQDARFRVAVPPGILVDFASIPRLLWSLFPPTDPRYSIAATLHDWLYACHTHAREDADAVLYRAARFYGTPRWRAWAIWSAVRLFGRGAYLSGPARQAELRAYYERVTGIVEGGPA